MKTNDFNRKRMKLLSFYFCLSGLIILGACSNKEETIVDQWLDKTVIIPDDLIYTRYGMDTIEYSTALSDYTILMYVDTVGCTSCQLQLERWQDWITYLKRDSPYNISFLFNFYPKDKEELLELLQFYQFNVPVCIDLEDRLNRLNKFPSGHKYHTFLLDKKCRVVLIGNPVNNEGIADLYRKVLVPSDSVLHDKKQTAVLIPRKKINLGQIPKDSIKAQFVIKNIGSEKLVLQHLSTSCGCTSVKYPKQPVSPGDSAIVCVQIEKQECGFFHETIRVYANIPKSPITLNITGSAL